MILYTCRYERPHADYIDKLPKGKHSCKGMIAFLEIHVIVICLIVRLYCML